MHGRTEAHPVDIQQFRVEGLYAGEADREYSEKTKSKKYAHVAQVAADVAGFDDF